MAPSFTLRGGLSPARTNLSIPQTATRTTQSSPTSPLASPASSAGRSGPSSPSHSATTPNGKVNEYFGTPNRDPPPQVSRDDAFKTAKALEALLGAWNEYRIAAGTFGKAGKKLAGAVKDLVGMMDKTEIPSQTLRPTSALLETVSETTMKLAKKMDKEYDEANGDASKYFTLLAKECRAHEAYLGAIGKKHDKAEKTYRKASKNMSDTSNAHVGLLALKDSLGKDIDQAQADHMSLLGSKQAMLLLRLSSSANVLASSLTSYFSEGLRKAGSAYRDIEYFGVLADIRWQGTIPSDLEEAEEEEKREGLRLMKARVALGEADVVGPHVWDRIRDFKSDIRTDKAADSVGGVQFSSSATGGGGPGPQALLANFGSQERSTAKGQNHVAGENRVTDADVVIQEMVSSAAPTAHAVSLSPIRTSERPHIPLYPGNYHTDSHHTTGRARRFSNIGSSRQVDTSHVQHSHTTAQDDPRDHHSSLNMIGSYSNPQQLSTSIPIRSTHTARSSSVIIPGNSRSVSQIAGDMEARSRNEREASFQAHQSHVDGYVRDCQLCSMDYDHRRLARPVPPVDLRGLRRVTMPPAYAQPEHFLPPGAGMRGSQSITSHLNEDYRHQRHGHDESIAAPVAQRPLRITPEFESYGHRA